MDSISFFDSTGTSKFVRGIGDGSSDTSPIAFAKVELPQPLDTSTYIDEFLENSGSSNMNVDGSSTSVTFSNPTTVPADKQLIISRLSIFIEGSTTLSTNKFGDVVALTNGVLLQLNTQDLYLFKENLDIILRSEDFSNQSTVLFSQINFPEGLKVSAANSLSAKIQDDLSSLVNFKMRIQGGVFEL